MDLERYREEPENKRAILRVLYSEQKASRNDLGDRLGLSPATVTKFVSELLTDGIVEESGELESTGGRRPAVLRITPDYRLVLCVDMGSYGTRLEVMRMDRSCVETLSVTTPGLAWETLEKHIATLVEKHGRQRFLGIGMGVSGLVDHERGEIIFSPNIKGLNGLKIRERFEKAFGVPTRLDTSTRCMALAEQRFGAGRGVRDQVCISIGHGIGAGIILGSRIYRGADGFAGEVGHIQVREDTVRCSCGNYGCLENYVTLPMLVDNVRDTLKGFTGYSPLRIAVGDIEKITKESLLAALEAGDKIVHEEMRKAGTWIGVAIANMANVVNPRLIVLGGGVIETFPMILDAVRSTVMERALIPVARGMTIARSPLSWRASLIGAQVLVMDQLVGEPD